MWIRIQNLPQRHLEISSSLRTTASSLLLGRVLTKFAYSNLLWILFLLGAALWYLLGFGALVSWIDKCLLLTFAVALWQGRQLSFPLVILCGGGVNSVDFSNFVVFVLLLIVGLGNVSLVRHLVVWGGSSSVDFSCSLGLFDVWFVVSDAVIGSVELWR